jgi:hypothetical protein
MSNGSVERLIVDMKESLERELHSFRDEMHTFRDEMRNRFDAQAARTDRQGGLLRSGQTNLVRLNDWSEKIDRIIEIRDKRLDDIEARLRKLEGRSQ